MQEMDEERGNGDSLTPQSEGTHRPANHPSPSGFPPDGPLWRALEQERQFRLSPKPSKPPPSLQPALHGGQRLEAALSCSRWLRYPRQQLIRSLAGAGVGHRQVGVGEGDVVQEQRTLRART